MILQSPDHILPGPGLVSRYSNEGDQVFRQVFFIQFSQCINENIDTLVLELITPAVDHQQAVAGHFPSGNCFCNSKNFFACCISFFMVIIPFGDKSVFKAIYGDHIGVFIKKMPALGGSDLTYRGEAVAFFGSNRFKGLLCLYTEVSGYTARIIIFEPAI